MLTKEGEVKSDVNIPEDEHLKDVVSKMKEIFEAGEKECLVTVLNCMGVEQVVDVREGAAVWEPLNRTHKQDKAFTLHSNDKWIL